MPHELFARNKHAGLYACKIFKKSHPKPSNLQEVKSHFVKARKLQHKVSSKVRNVKPFSAHKNHGLTVVQSVFPTTHSKNFQRESKTRNFPKSSEFVSDHHKPSKLDLSRLILKQKVLSEELSLISVSRKKSGTNRTQRPSPRNFPVHTARTTHRLRRARKSYCRNRNF